MTNSSLKVSVRTPEYLNSAPIQSVATATAVNRHRDFFHESIEANLSDTSDNIDDVKLTERNLAMAMEALGKLERGKNLENMEALNLYKITLLFEKVCNSEIAEQSLHRLLALKDNEIEILKSAVYNNVHRKAVIQEDINKGIDRNVAPRLHDPQKTGMQVFQERKQAGYYLRNLLESQRRHILPKWRPALKKLGLID